MGRLALRPGLRAYAHAPAADTGVAYSNTKSMSFDGVDDYFATASGGGLPTGSASNPCSVSFWVKLNSTPSGTVSILGSNKVGGGSGGSSEKPRMQINSASNAWMGNRMFITIDGDSYGYSSFAGGGGGVFTVGTWAHFVVTDLGLLQASPVAVTVYKNASSSLTWEGEDYTTSNAQQFYIGGMAIHGGKFRDCTIDEVGVWRSHVLSSAEVTAIYNSGTPTDLADTAGVTAPDSYWRMGDLTDTDGTSGVIYDRIGSYDLTAGSGDGSGAPAVSTSVP